MTAAPMGESGRHRHSDSRLARPDVGGKTTTGGTGGTLSGDGIIDWFTTGGATITGGAGIEVSIGNGCQFRNPSFTVADVAGRDGSNLITVVLRFNSETARSNRPLASYHLPTSDITPPAQIEKIQIDQAGSPVERANPSSKYGLLNI
ncbi:MAG: hypothetical protein ABJA67_06510, partial [Chthonomonadales bacterium]